jgi:uncharacterized protein (TIGR04255 family)
LDENRFDLKRYLQIAPLPDGDGLMFDGFLNQHTASELATGNRVRAVLAAGASANDRLPIIFDIAVEAAKREEPANWDWIQEQIQTLRGLKNRVFRGMLTNECLNLFQ